MDRTTWKFGKVQIDILVVTVAMEGVAFPVACVMLPIATKRGNARKDHRLAVMEWLLELMARTDIKVLTMNREFIGRQWLEWLNTMEIPSIVRVKKSDKIGSAKAESLCRRRAWRKLLSQRQSV